MPSQKKYSFDFKKIKDLYESTYKQLDSLNDILLEKEEERINSLKEKDEENIFFNFINDITNPNNYKIEIKELKKIIKEYVPKKLSKKVAISKKKINNNKSNKNNNLNNLKNQIYCLNKFKDVQTSFENTVSHVYNNQSGESIIELNKIVIKLFIDKLNYFKQKEVKEGNNSNLESISNLKSEMADEINNNFNLKKQELEDSMKREVPNEIDFTISKDEPIKEDIDKLINNVITNRNLEINTILKSQAKP